MNREQYYLSVIRQVTADPGDRGLSLKTRMELDHANTVEGRATDEGEVDPVVLDLFSTHDLANALRKRCNAAVLCFVTPDTPKNKAEVTFGGYEALLDFMATDLLPKVAQAIQNKRPEGWQRMDDEDDA
jgi:hypothetical protein